MFSLLSTSITYTTMKPHNIHRKVQDIEIGLRVYVSTHARMIYHNWQNTITGLLVIVFLAVVITTLSGKGLMGVLAKIALIVCAAALVHAVMWLVEVWFNKNSTHRIGINALYDMSDRINHRIERDFLMIQKMSDTKQLAYMEMLAAEMLLELAKENSGAKIYCTGAAESIVIAPQTQCGILRNLEQKDIDTLQEAFNKKRNVFETTN